MDTDTRTMMPGWLSRVRLFLLGLGGTLGVCGLLCGILMILSQGSSEVPEVLGNVLLPVVFGLPLAAVGALLELRESPAGVGVPGLVAAVALFSWAWLNIVDIAEASWQVNPAVDPKVLWAALMVGCLGAGSLVLVVFSLLGFLRPKARVVRPGGRVAVSCGVLVALVGLVVGHVMVADKFAPVRVMTGLP